MSQADIATLGIRVTTDGVSSATIQLNGLTNASERSETSTKRLASASESLSSSVNKLAKLYAAYISIQQLFDVAKLSARYETLGVSMNTVGSNAGYSSGQMKQFQSDLEQTGITAIGAREALTKMASAQLDLAKASDLGRVAQDAAVIANVNSTDAFESMVRAIQTGQTEILHTLGLNVSFENAYKRLASQLGKTTTELTTAEKLQARLNETLRIGAQNSGVYEAAMGTAGKQLKSTERYIKNLKTKFGEIFNDALIIGVSDFTRELKKANGELDDSKVSGKVKEWQQSIASIYTYTVAVAKSIFGIGVLIGNSLGVIWTSWMSLAQRAYYTVIGNHEAAAAVVTKTNAEIADRVKLAGQVYDSINSTLSAESNLEAERQQNAAKDLEDSQKIEEYRKKLGNATREETRAQEALASARKKLTDELKPAEDALRKYSSAIQGFGETIISVSKDAYAKGLENFKSLATEAGVINTSAFTGPLQQYLGSINKVSETKIKAINAEIEGYSRIRDALANSSDKEAQNKAIEYTNKITELTQEQVEVKKNAAKQELDAYSELYKDLENLEKTFVEQTKSDMKLLQSTLDQFATAMADFEKTSPEYKKLSATDKYSQESSTLAKSFEEISSRNVLTADDYQKKMQDLINLQQKVIDLRKTVPKEGIGAGAFKITDEKAYNDALKFLDQIKEQIEQTGNARIADDMQKLTQIQALKAEIGAYIGEMQSNLAILEQQALDTSNALVFNPGTGALDIISQMVTKMDELTVAATRAAAEVARVQSIGAGVSVSGVGAPTAAAQTTVGAPIQGSYDIGTSYVPKTGIYMLHQGEEVKRKTDASSNSSSLTIAEGAIVIHTQAKDAKSIVKELIPELRLQLGRLR